MATTAKFTVDSKDFALGSSFENFTGIRIELEKIVPTSAAVVPYLWVRGVESEEIKAALKAHQATQQVTVVERINDNYLLRVDWNPGHEEFLTILADATVIMLSATGTAMEWEFVIRGDDRESISKFQTYCQEAGIPIKLTSLSDLSSVDSEDEYGLTDTQREALVLAFERGYFDSPREMTLKEVAEELDISRQAFASRLRCGHRRLIENTLARP